MMLLSKSGAKLNELFPILDELTKQMAWKKEIVRKMVVYIERANCHLTFCCFSIGFRRSIAIISGKKLSPA
jgi:hypothetical protein